MKKYLSTAHIADMYDVSQDFFRNHMDSTFKRGVHYVQHDKSCPIRWDIEEVEAWWRGEDQSLDKEKINALIEKLLV